MEKTTWIIIISILTLTILATVSFATAVNYEKFSKKPTYYSYTRAVCSSGNECIDLLIECENSQVKSVTTISKKIKFSDDWQDSRPKKEKFCNM